MTFAIPAIRSVGTCVGCNGERSRTIILTSVRRLPVNSMDKLNAACLIHRIKTCGVKRIKRKVYSRSLGAINLVFLLLRLLDCFPIYWIKVRYADKFSPDSPEKSFIWLRSNERSAYVRMLFFLWTVSVICQGFRDLPEHALVSVHRGLLQFICLPFGTATAAVIFQLLEVVLSYIQDWGFEVRLDQCTFFMYISFLFLTEKIAQAN